MVLDTKQTTLAYRCPKCGAGVMSAVNMFNLSADMIALKCDCGGSELKAQFTAGGEVRLTVPCIICPKPHNYTINKSVFFGKDLFVLPCPYSDINMCFIGEINQVKAELARTELELLDILEQSGMQDFTAINTQEENTLADPQILDIVKFVVHDLDAEGKIYCNCKDARHEPLADDEEYDPEDSRFEIEVTDEGILVRCRECGAKRLIPTDSLLGAHAFLNSDSLYLE